MTSYSIAERSQLHSKIAQLICFGIIDVVGLLRLRGENGKFIPVKTTKHVTFPQFQNRTPICSLGETGVLLGAVGVPLFYEVIRSGNISNVLDSVLPFWDSCRKCDKGLAKILEEIKDMGD